MHHPRSCCQSLTVNHHTTSSFNLTLQIEAEPTKCELYSRNQRPCTLMFCHRFVTVAKHISIFFLATSTIDATLATEKIKFKSNQGLHKKTQGSRRRHLTTLWFWQLPSIHHISHSSIPFIFLSFIIYYEFHPIHGGLSF